MERSRGARRGETTETGAHRSQSLAPHTESIERRLEPGVWEHRSTERGLAEAEGKFMHPYQVNANHCVDCGGAEEDFKKKKEKKVEDLSLDFTVDS